MRIGVPCNTPCMLHASLLLAALAALLLLAVTLGCSTPEKKAVGTLR
jgi:hypothetical protein